MDAISWGTMDVLAHRLVCLVFAMAAVGCAGSSRATPMEVLRRQAAGFVSFASPRVLPLVPVYLLSVSGTGFD